MVLRSFILIGFFAFFAFACQESEDKAVQAQETPQEKAASLYTMHCAQCHGEDGKLGASGAKDLSVSKLTDPQIRQIIKSGKNAMPPMGALLETQENIDLVIKHIKELRQ
jgi:mono/diheme cytochrome c family protein